MHEKKGLRGFLGFLDSSCPLVYTYKVDISLWMKDSTALMKFILLASVYCFNPPRDVWIHTLSSKLSALLLCYVINLISSSAVFFQDLGKKKAKQNPDVRDLAPGRASQTRAVSTFLEGKWMKVGAIWKTVVLSGGKPQKTDSTAEGRPWDINVLTGVGEVGGGGVVGF